LNLYNYFNVIYGCRKNGTIAKGGYFKWVKKNSIIGQFSLVSNCISRYRQDFKWSESYQKRYSVIRIWVAAIILTCMCRIWKKL